MELHQPIPKFRDKGLADKIRTFLLRIDAGSPFQRMNWSLTVGHYLDTAMETSNEWGRRFNELTPENIGSLLHLRGNIKNCCGCPEAMPKEKLLLDVLWKWASKSPIPAKSADAALASGRVIRHHRSSRFFSKIGKKRNKRHPALRLQMQNETACSGYLNQ